MIGATRTSTKVMFWIIVIIVLGIIGGSVYCGVEIGRYKIVLGDSQIKTERLESELTSTKAALAEAKTTAIYLRDSLDRIRAERDTLVENFGIIRNSLDGLIYGATEGDELIESSIRILNEIIEIFDYLEGIDLFSID